MTSQELFKKNDVDFIITHESLTHILATNLTYSEFYQIKASPLNRGEGYFLLSGYDVN
jgi:hypothetical protein